MPTEFIDQKAANLKAQILSLETTRYLQTLVVNDSETLTGDEKADMQLAAAAREASVQVAVLTRQIEVRKRALAALEQEQAKSVDAKAAKG